MKLMKSVKEDGAKAKNMANPKKVKKFYQDVTKHMMTRLNFGRVAEDGHRTFGWDVEHDQGNIYVSQVNYIENKLERLNSTWNKLVFKKQRPRSPRRTSPSSENS